MRVATAACTVGTPRATGRNTPAAGGGPASAGLPLSTSSGIRQESWASSASATSTGDSVPTDSGEDLMAADSVAVSTAVALSTVAAATVEPVAAQGTGGIPMSSWRSLIVAVTLLLGAALATAWPAGPVAAAEDVPPVANQESSPRLADRPFRVEGTAGARRQGQTRIIGYVYNESDHDAANVQLRISELDASGRTVKSVIKPMGNPVPAAGRAFFDLQVPNTSPSYRVEVESFGFMDNPWTTKRTEQLLANAGFHMKLADTPEERANQLYYVYADPDLCKCLYVGTSMQYERALQESFANDQLIAIGEQLNALAWDLWAPWPWY